MTVVARHTMSGCLRGHCKSFPKVNGRINYTSLRHSGVSLGSDLQPQFIDIWTQRQAGSFADMFDGGKENRQIADEAEGDRAVGRRRAQGLEV